MNKNIMPSLLVLLSILIIFLATYICIWSMESPQRTRNGFQRFLRQSYLNLFGYGDKEFYSRFTCQRKMLFPYEVEEDTPRSPYSTGLYQSAEKETYLRSIFNNRLSPRQREILLEDVFDWSLSECSFGAEHKKTYWRTYMASEISGTLIRTMLEELTQENAILLLKWLIHTYPMVLGDDIKGILDEKYQIERLLLDPRIPREIVWDAFNTLLVNYNSRIETLTVSGSLYPKKANGANLINYNYEFLRAFILDSRRTQEEITALAYKPYLWLIPNLNESPLMREEERAVSALMATGAQE